MAKRFLTTTVAAQNEEAMYRAIVRAARVAQKKANLSEFTRQMERGNVEAAIAALGIDIYEEELGG